MNDIKLPELPTTLAWASVNEALAMAVQDYARAAVLADREAIGAGGVGGERILNDAQNQDTHKKAIMGDGNVAVGTCENQHDGMSGIIYLALPEDKKSRPIGADTTDVFPIGTTPKHDEVLACVYFKTPEAIQQTIDILLELKQNKFPESTQHASVPSDELESVEDMAHRMCLKYMHSTDPDMRMYTFGKLTLHDFARALLAKCGNVQVAAVVHRIGYIKIGVDGCPRAQLITAFGPDGKLWTDNTAIFAAPGCAQPSPDAEGGARLDWLVNNGCTVNRWKLNDKYMYRLAWPNGDIQASWHTSARAAIDAARGREVE